MPQAHICSHTLSRIVYKYMGRHSQQLAPSLVLQVSLKCSLLSSSELIQVLLFLLNIPVLNFLWCQFLVKPHTSLA